MASAFAKKPIDGNEILRQISAEKNGQGGTITDHQTGRVLASSNGAPGVAIRKQVIPEGYTPEDWNSTLERDAATGPDPEQSYSNAGATVDGMTYSEAESDYGDNSMSPNMAFEEGMTDTLNNMDGVSKFMKKAGLSYEDIYNDIPSSVDDKTIAMIIDPSKIKTEEDMDLVKDGMEGVYDALRIDHKKWIEEGIMEECGAECQERRQLMDVQAQEISEQYKNPLSMGDEEFLARNGMLGE